MPISTPSLAPANAGLLDSIRQTLSAAGLLHPSRPARVLVAVSGGVDSVALLHATAQVCKKHPQLSVVAAIIDHGWRTPPMKELDPVWQQCQQWNVPLYSAMVSRTLAKTETVARQARYKALVATAQQTHSHAILTAHHMDDQIETVIMRMLKGTSIQGLSGIPAMRVLSDAQIPVLRPWLNITKDELIAYAEVQQLRWENDTTNDDTRHLRNAIRKDILPYLEKTFPHTRQALSKLANLASEEQELTEALVSPYWQNLFDGRQLHLTELNQLAPTLKKALLIRFMQHHQLPVDYDTIGRVLAFIDGSEPETRTSQRLSIASPDPEHETHTQLAINQHTLRVVTQGASPGETTTSSSSSRSSETDGLNLGPDPVAFRLPQLFPTWAGVGPAAAAADDDIDKDAIRSESQLDDVSDDDDDDDMDDTTGIDASDDTDDDDMDDNEPSDDEADLDSEAAIDSDDAELDEDSDENLTEANPDNPDADNNDDTEDDEEDVSPKSVSETAGKLIDTPTLLQSRTQFIVLPEYNAELEITRLAPDDLPPNPLPKPTELTIYANLKLLINDTLSIRYRRSGDRIHPLGMMNAMRLKNYFINRGIPQELRDTIPLLTSGGDVLWVVGSGFSELLRIEQRPTHRLTWRWLDTPSV